MGWTGVAPRQWAEKSEANIQLALKKIALEMFSRIILRSPVDTGRFRGNWQVSIGSIADGTLDIDDQSGAVTVSKTQAAALGLSAGDSISLVNNLPYAEELENGGSGQAPQGMVALTVQEFETVVRQVGLEIVRL